MRIAIDWENVQKKSCKATLVHLFLKKKRWNKGMLQGWKMKIQIMYENEK